MEHLILAKKKITNFPVNQIKIYATLSSRQNYQYFCKDLESLNGKLSFSQKFCILRKCTCVPNTFQGLGNHFKKRRIYVSLTFRYSFWCKLFIKVISDKLLHNYSRISNKRVNTDHFTLQNPTSTRPYWIPTRSVSSEARSAEVAEFFLRIQTFWH